MARREEVLEITRQIFETEAKLAKLRDRFAALKAEYEKAGPERSNLRYGYVVPNGPVDYSVFA